MDVKKIRKASRRELYFTQHALEKMIERNISEVEVEEVLGSGEIIEEYPRDKYGPSCLIFGFRRGGKALHVLVSYSEPLWVVTVYEPVKDEWIDFRVRKIK